ncbi:MAG: hypothetical protein V3V72_13620 [Ignavibacteriaceae bacterium]
MNEKIKFEILSSHDVYFKTRVEAWLNDDDIQIMSISYEAKENNWYIAYITYREI